MDSDKLIDIITGNEFNIKELPLVVGSLSKFDKLNINHQFELEHFVGKTINVNKEQLSLETLHTKYPLNVNNIHSKLIISTCPIIYPYDFIITKDEDKNEYNIFSFGKVFINGVPTKSNQFSNINSYDIISYNCCLFNHDHVFIFITKKLRKLNTFQKNCGLNNMNSLNSNYYNNTENNNSINFGVDRESYDENKNGATNDDNYIKNTEIQFPNYPADETIPSTWKAHEKEALKKNLLLYGYNRWNTIRTNSSNTLMNKTDQELKAYSNSFIRCIIQLTKDKKEITNFLSNLIQEKEKEPWIVPNTNDWGDLIIQRAPAWGKRIKYLYYIKNTIDIFKTLKANNKDKRKLLNNFNNYLSEEEKNNIKSKINPIYDNWCNLLWFLPNNLLFGQAPVSWWTKIHDIDLLRGTYKHGYANYGNIKSDKKYCFSSLEQNNQNKDFPSSDSITRRLKKIVQIIIKNWNNNNELMNMNENDKLLGKNNNKKAKELNDEEKRQVFEFLIEYGLPRKINGEENYLLIYEKLKEKKIFNEIIEKDELNELILGIKSFITGIKIQLQILIDEENKKDKDTIQIEELNISVEKAKLFLDNIHMFDIIRKKIIVKHYKLFNENLNKLIEENSANGVPEKCRDPNNWNCAINDKLLFYFIDEYGLTYLPSKLNEMSVFQKCNLNYDEYIQRIKYLCEYFEEIIKLNKLSEKVIQNQRQNQTSNNIIKIKTSDFLTGMDNYYNNLEMSSSKDIKEVCNNKIDNKFIVNKDENGNIIYPIIINNNLKILNLGTINYTNKNYHSEKNIFPVGFKSVREHQSMFNLQKRAEYTCEILDGGAKPQYKLTSSEDVEHPIIRDSSTACWIVVGNAINELQGNKRKKVTISGTERFGLIDPKVVKLLSTLPNADKVIKQMSKFDDDDARKKK